MIQLPKDFVYRNYGITARLVTEQDANFIVNLRSNDKLGRFIHASNGSVEKQIEWTREYKEREAAGLDYYFIFSKDGEDFGLCRIYNIDWTHLSYTSGSWIIKMGTPEDIAMIPSVMLSDIANEILGLQVDLYDVRKENKQVLRYHRMILCAIQYGETELDYLFMSTPETRTQSKLRRLLNLPPFDKNQFKI